MAKKTDIANLAQPPRSASVLRKHLPELQEFRNRIQGLKGGYTNSPDYRRWSEELRSLLKDVYPDFPEADRVLDFRRGVIRMKPFGAPPGPDARDLKEFQEDLGEAEIRIDVLISAVERALERSVNSAPPQALPGGPDSQGAAPGDRKPRHGFMVFSDLHGSTQVLWRNFDDGVRLQSLHVELCLKLSALTAASDRFKAMGDGVLIEFETAREACEFAVKLRDAARSTRSAASGDSPEKSLFPRITVASGELVPASGTQRWVGVLPTKVTRFSKYGRKDEIWIDQETRSALVPHLQAMSLECDSNCLGGAAFRVPLRGAGQEEFQVHQLRSKGEPSGYYPDELEKEWKLSWDDVMGGVNDLLSKIEETNWSFSQVLGVGRGGVIVGSMLAGNAKLKTPDGHHLPVHALERVHPEAGSTKRLLSTLTEAPEDPSHPKEGAPPVQGGSTILAVVSESRSGDTVKAVRDWLSTRGVTNVKFAALLAADPSKVDFFWLRAKSALLPWQFRPAYDMQWKGRPSGSAKA